MNQKTAFTFLGAAVLASTPFTSHAAELLINGNFESLAQGTNGDHVGTTADGWVVTGGSANLTRGVITTGTVSGTAVSNLPLDPYESGSQQSLDISATGTTYHLFTASFNAPVTVKFDIGGRDLAESDGSAPVGSSWAIYNSTGTTLIVAGATTLNPALNQWLTNTSTTAVNLTAGTQYRFVVNLDNPDHVDGLSITQVPEPTTAAAASIGLGLLSWLGYKRRRRL